jgi:hypothetical protein
VKPYLRKNTAIIKTSASMIGSDSANIKDHVCHTYEV